MINYHNYCQIHALAKEGFSALKISEKIGLNEKTVRKWLATPTYRQRPGVRMESKLAPYKSEIKKWIEQADFSTVQIYQKLQTSGYTGGITIVGDYLRILRPKRHRAYQTVQFAPGDAAQIDWGTFESISVGSTRRKLSFLVVVLCHSRMLYVECFLQERMEHFLAGLVNAFAHFQGVPKKLIVDNMKTAVCEHNLGQEPKFHPRFIDLCNHYGTHAVACTPRRPYEKGRVEAGVGYVKGNFFNGRDLSQLPVDQPLESLNTQLRHWTEQIANLRKHKETQHRPIDLLATDRAAMIPLNLNFYDTGVASSARVNNRCRVLFDANRYSVPPQHSQQRVQLHRYHDRLCIYAQNKLIALHPRCYGRHQQIVHPDHQRELLEQYQRGQQTADLIRFEQLDSIGPTWLANLRQSRFGYMHHVRKILHFVDLYGANEVVDAMRRAHEHSVYSSEIILNLIERKHRFQNIITSPSVVSPTAQTRSLLDLRLSNPDLDHYPGNSVQSSLDTNL